MRAIVLCAAFVALAVSGPASAMPKNKVQAREVFERGIRHYNLSEFAEALEAFKQAYRLYPDPLFLLDIGQCQRQLGDKPNAIRSYRAYLRDTPNAANQSKVEALIRELERSVSEDERVKNQPPREAVRDPESSGVQPAEASQSAPRAPQVASESPQTVILASPATRPARKSRAWVWGLVCGAVAAGVGLGVGLGLGLQHGPNITLGTVQGN